MQGARLKGHNTIELLVTTMVPSGYDGSTSTSICRGSFTSLVCARDVWMGFLNDISQDPGKDFLEQTSSVRNTLEQIDVSYQLIHKYSDPFGLALTSHDVSCAVRRGKISAPIGIERSGTSPPFSSDLAARTGATSSATLSARCASSPRSAYATLSHTCHNAFTDSSGLFVEPPHHGLKLVRDLNRLGAADLSLAALNISRAPVIWSHSSTCALRDIPRNVPDEVLWHIGTGAEQLDGVVMVNFLPGFVSEGPDPLASRATMMASIAAQPGSKTSQPTPYSSRNYTAADDLQTNCAALQGVEDVVREGVAPAQDLYEKCTDIPKKH
ncbi:membrane dipeptidase-domain-containing protein [Lactarius vividus]|nr:membrane dipeptidase-domain-containing protein [Lactarius vividus]